MKKEKTKTSSKKKKVYGCSTCPQAGHFELRECPDAYTKIAEKCALYDKRELWK